MNKLIFILIAILMIFATNCENILDPYEAPKIDQMVANHYTVNPGDTVTVTVEAENPEDGPLEYEWAHEGGELIPPTDKSEVKWKVPSQGGTYEISVKVSNEKKSKSKSLEITVRSFTIPYIEIISPEQDEPVTQYTLMTIEAMAQHANGISSVHLYINDSVQPVQSLSGHSSDEYNFYYTLNDSPGPAEIKIQAIANVTGVTGEDSVSITIEGIIPGKFRQTFRE